MSSGQASYRTLFGLIAIVVILIAWTGAAGEWDNRECSLGQGYVFVIAHGGGPDEHEGCEDEPGGAVYTDEYGSW
ncbi:hypothetical protein J7I98_23670 [Streptomyces sp. ISL-98]|uniref:hypothetical protein n=1 Tax=Streptomyces sp. ISL-98 TaxID=2819192 RepID=UPI001BEC6730|nr:hypothetical protein [Streptomyces sp. ISL-98]MBT2508830.1 hypothetical protein [Streptomyces sp. ISL-98]